MQPGNEKRVLWNVDAALRKPCTGVRVVEELRKKPCRNLTGMAAARAAMIGAFMRIVGDVAAMPEQQDITPMAFGEAHGIE